MSVKKTALQTKSKSPRGSKAKKVKKTAKAAKPKKTTVRKAPNKRSQSVSAKPVKKRPARKKPARRVKKAAVKKVLKAAKARIVYQNEPMGDLPFSYDMTKLVLLVRDPHWAYGYWDFSGETWKWIEELRAKHGEMRSVLRVQNCDENTYFDIDVQLETKNWYLNLGSPDTDFEAQLGLIDANGKFYLIAGSNRIHMPGNGPSNVVDSNWQPVQFDEVYQLSGGGTAGHGSESISSPFRK